jgi:hypothetical protein
MNREINICLAIACKVSRIILVIHFVYKIDNNLLGLSPIIARYKIYKTNIVLLSDQIFIQKFISIIGFFIDPQLLKF